MSKVPGMTVIQVRVTRGVAEAFKAIAQAEFRSTSAQASMVINAYVRDNTPNETVSDDPPIVLPA